MANNIGWGKGASNNSIGWGNVGTNGFGSVYETSSSGDIDLVGITSPSAAFKQRVLDDSGAFEAQQCLDDLISQGLFDSANFVLTPNGYKAGKLYALKPDSGDLDIIWQRNGNATRVNKDGLIKEVGNDVPRLDYTNSDCPSLLVEDQSTNLYSLNNTNNLNGKFTGFQFINKEIIPNVKGDIFGYKAELSNPSSFLSSGMRFTQFNLSAYNSYSCSFILRIEPNETKKFFGINVSGGNASFFIDLETLNYETLSLIFNESVIKLNDTDYLISFASTGDNFFAFSQFRMAFINNINSANPTPLEGTYTIIGFGIYNNVLGRQSIIKTNGSAVTRPADAPLPITPPIGTTEIVEVFEDGTTNTITTIPLTYIIPFGRFKYILFN